MNASGSTLTIIYPRINVDFQMQQTNNTKPNAWPNQKMHQIWTADSFIRLSGDLIRQSQH